MYLIPFCNVLIKSAFLHILQQCFPILYALHVYRQHAITVEENEMKLKKKCKFKIFPKVFRITKYLLH